MSHTPTPWVIDVEASGDYTLRGKESDTYDAIANDTSYYPSAPSIEDAEFILKCVNAHDELVAALQEIDALIPKPSLPLTHEIKRVVQKALAKAGAL